MKNIYHQAIELWLIQTEKNEDINPSDGIIFSLLNKNIPPDNQTPNNIVELCQLINHLQNYPPLTEEEEMELQLIGVQIYRSHKSVTKKYSLGMMLIWLTRVVYALAALALFFGAGAFRWWIVGLVVATFWSRGAISMAIRGRDAGEYRDSNVSFSIVIHNICLVSLFTCSAIVIVNWLRS
jgi:hypothetical protein